MKRKRFHLFITLLGSLFFLSHCGGTKNDKDNAPVPLTNADAVTDPDSSLLLSNCGEITTLFDVSVGYLEGFETHSADESNSKKYLKHHRKRQTLSMP